jgi:hypothetical protein
MVAGCAMMARIKWRADIRQPPLDRGISDMTYTTADVQMVEEHIVQGERRI